MTAWAQRDKLILNETKTVIINFGLQKQLPCDIVLHENIDITHCTKLLGTHLDDKLSWSQHIEHVCTKLNKAYFALLHLKNVLGEAGLISVYYALAYTHISYNIIAWGSATDRDRKEISIIHTGLDMGIY
ncbi:hypothetical protein NQ317_012114 [Molorchus minor]|uniref:Reverse transcriptase n=1 Tax=Molorchus minor TaxID=1323400 RepID=A0ABQ9IQR4_9CUCU|nr:hypothetical protein NQ317_012114 [Molorchus minor]